MLRRGGVYSCTDKGRKEAETMTREWKRGTKKAKGEPHTIKLHRVKNSLFYSSSSILHPDDRRPIFKTTTTTSGRMFFAPLTKSANFQQTIENKWRMRKYQRVISRWKNNIQSNVQHTYVERALNLMRVNSIISTSKRVHTYRYAHNNLHVFLFPFCNNNRYLMYKFCTLEVNIPLHEPSPSWKEKKQRKCIVQKSNIQNLAAREWWKKKCFIQKRRRT